MKIQYSFILLLLLSLRSVLRGSLCSPVVPAPLPLRYATWSLRGVVDNERRETRTFIPTFISFIFFISSCRSMRMKVLVSLPPLPIKELQKEAAIMWWNCDSSLCFHRESSDSWMERRSQVVSTCNHRLWTEGTCERRRRPWFTLYTLSTHPPCHRRVERGCGTEGKGKEENDRWKRDRPWSETERERPWQRFPKD